MFVNYLKSASSAEHTSTSTWSAN